MQNMTELFSTAICRRLAIALIATGILAGTNAHAEEPDGRAKLTVLYGAPKDPDAFEKYYANIHMPLVYAVKGIKRVELAKPLPGPQGQPPAFYRIAEVYFESLEQMQSITATPEWKKAAADVPNYATGGATFLTSRIQ
jgi:uncharacterized protein (TIGR02118 family)